MALLSILRPTLWRRRLGVEGVTHARFVAVWGESLDSVPRVQEIGTPISGASTLLGLVDAGSMVHKFAMHAWTASAPTYLLPGECFTEMLLGHKHCWKNYILLVSTVKRAASSMLAAALWDRASTSRTYSQSKGLRVHNLQALWGVWCPRCLLHNPLVPNSAKINQDSLRDTHRKKASLSALSTPQALSKTGVTTASLRSHVNQSQVKSQKSSRTLSGPPGPSPPPGG